MHELLVESIAWQRITMTLSGRIAPDASAVDLAGNLFLKHAETGERVDLIVEPTEVGGFSARLNVMLAVGQYPLADGVWRLCTQRADVRITAVDALARPTAENTRRFEGITYRYVVAPSRDEETRALRFGISSERFRALREDSAAAGVFVRALRAVRNGAYLALYEVARALVPKNGRRVLFTSDSRAGLSGNLHLIHDRMVERGLDRDFEISTAFKPSVTADRPLFDKLAFTYRLATADVVLLDDYHPMIYKVHFDKSVKLIQVWHASGAFKTVGYSRIGKPGGPNPFSAVHKNYTSAIVSSAHDVPFYAEAFGLPEDRVVPTGIPRMDLFFDDAAKTRLRDGVLEAVPIARNRKIILFAPTFRGQGPSDAHYDFDLLDLPALHELCVEIDAVCIFKMHPFVTEPLELPAEFEDRFFDATQSREINDFLVAADLVITDYSSLVFEYSTLNRPMLFFAYDLEEYVAERDFYEEFTEFVPGRIVHTFAALLGAIRGGDFEFEKVARFAHEHVAHLDAGSTDRVIDQLIVGARSR